MNAIIIKRKLTDKEIDLLSNILSGETRYKIITSINLPQQFSKYEIEAFQDDLLLKKKINYYSLDKILSFSEKLIKDKTISEILSLEENISIFQYNKFRLYYSICDIFYEINLIKSYAKEYSKILYFTSSNELKLYAGLPANADIIYLDKEKKIRINYISLFNYLLFFKIKLVQHIFKINMFKNRKHIIADHPQRQTYIDLYSLKERRDSTFYQYLFDKIENDFLVLREEFVPKFRDIKTFKLNKFLFRKKKYAEFSREIILFKSLFSYNIFIQLKSLSLRLRNSYDFISASNLDDEEKLILSFIKSYYKSCMYFIFRYLAFKRFFSKHPELKTITAADENSPLLKTIIDAAKANNITTVGMQHGNIHDLHPAYIFTEADKRNRIMTDYTLVWGKYYKEFLSSKANYPEDSLKIIGQIRTDVIPLLEKAKFQITSDIITSEQKLILFASQPQKDDALRYKAAFDMFMSVKDINNVLLIVKLHPAEINDFNYYHSIAKEAGCYNYKIIYYYDLYLLLSRADVVITCFSTVGSEAIYFRKPLIILDHLKQDIQNYHKLGLAFQATDASELKNYIVEILSGKTNINQLAYDSFIENYAYKIDGNVSQRYIDFIKSF